MKLLNPKKLTAFLAVSVLWTEVACAPALQPEPINLSESLSSAQSDLFLTSATTSIIGYWKLDETASGSASGGFDFSDSSGLNNSLKVLGSQPIYGVTGEKGTAVDMSSAGTANSSLVISNKTSELSFGVWVKWSGNTASKPIFYNGSPGSDGYGFWLANGTTNTAGNKIELRMGGGVATNALNSSFTLTPGVWTQLFVTCSGGTWSLYVNGTLYSTGSGTPNTPTNNTFIGNFPGVMDEVSIWNSALSADDVHNLYVVQQGQFGS